MSFSDVDSANFGELVRSATAILGELRQWEGLPPTRTLAAMLAMQGLLAGNLQVPVEQYRHGFLAQESVDCADALLVRLKETEPKT